MQRRMTLGDFLVAYLRKIGVNRVFGIPGDLALRLFFALCRVTLSNLLWWVGACSGAFQSLRLDSGKGLLHLHDQVEQQLRDYNVVKGTLDR